MTRKEKVNVLEWYCHNCRDVCAGCPIDDIENCECDFPNMEEAMLNEQCKHLKETDLAAYENAVNECCHTEPDDLKLHIDPKIARHYAICQKLNAVYKAKNHDYGDSFGDTFKKLGIISAVTRLSDKMNRLMSLAVSHNAQVKDEKIEDTLLDMANYAIMTLIELGYEVDE